MLVTQKLHWVGHATKVKLVDMKNFPIYNRKTSRMTHTEKNTSRMKITIDCQKAQAAVDIKTSIFNLQ